MYDCKEFITENGKIIHSYNNLFTFDEKQTFYSFFMKSLFVITGCDSIYDKNNGQVYSSYSHDDLTNLGMTNTKGFKHINELYSFNMRKMKQIRLNCSTPFEKSNAHSDYSGLTLLYYVNREWNLNWMGHTMFLNEKMDEVEYISLYQPGKVVIFDGTIPHMIATQNYQSQDNRLSFVIQYGEIQSEQKWISEKN